MYRDVVAKYFKLNDFVCINLTFLDQSITTDHNSTYEST